jgi:hypothetical protein
MALLLWLVVLSCLLAAPCSLLSRGGAAEPPSDKQIERWIEDLGSDRFEVREVATRELKEREEAAVALYKALRSPDAEVRRRAVSILEALKPKRARRALARAYALGKEGRIVEAVDRLVYWGEWDKDKKGWDTLTHFADKLMEHAGDVCPQGDRDLWKKPGLPAGDFRRYLEAKMPNRETLQPKEISGRKIMNPHALVILARGEQVIIKRDNRGSRGIAAYSIVVASEDIQIDHIGQSLIVAGGDIKTICPMKSILVCDGDVELQEPPERGLIVARGKVTCRNRKLTGCAVRSEDYFQFHDGKKIIIKDGVPDPVGFVKFFELSDVGLTVSDRDQKEEPIKDGVRLKDVRKDSPFASRLRAGDVVTALDETKIASPEVFRRLLRRKLGQGVPILTFTLRRSGETLDVPIPMKD